MRMASCHPEQKHHCKDLCKTCYGKAVHAHWKVVPGYLEKAAIRSKQWARDNPQKVYNSDANKHLIKKYGITLKEYNELLNSQNGLCALCNKPESIISKKRVCRLAVDHCHKTGKIRGLLCFKCNTSISILEKNHSIIDKLKVYLGV